MIKDVEDPLVVSNIKQYSEIKKKLKKPPYRKETYRLRPGVTLDLFISEEVFR